tara:strand:+ start:195 stop:983 length:789 start_codon:yes stop_codon:yes gene_type:complete
LDFSNRYILGFSLALCLICATAVSALHESVVEKQKANAILDKQINILRVAGLLDSETTPSQSEVDVMFEDVDAKVINQATGDTLHDQNPWQYNALKAAKASTSGVDASELPSGPRALAKQIQVKRLPKSLIVYEVQKPGKECLVLPIWGNGLWSLLQGFVAIDLSGNRVIGITFFSHKETAGLGGEIDNPEWKAQWPGKILFKDGAVAATVVKKGAVKDPTIQVDGIAGATITSLAVGRSVHLWLGESGYGPFLNKLQEVTP